MREAVIVYIYYMNTTNTTNNNLSPVLDENGLSIQEAWDHPNWQPGSRAEEIFERLNFLTAPEFRSIKEIDEAGNYAWMDWQGCWEYSDCAYTRASYAMESDDAEEAALGEELYQLLRN